jgi:hypothetical protein
MHHILNDSPSIHVLKVSKIEVLGDLALSVPRSAKVTNFTIDPGLICVLVRQKTQNRLYF